MQTVDEKKKALDKEIMALELELHGDKDHLAKQKDIGMLESFGVGALDGASMGFSDEIAAGAKSLFKGTKYDDEVKAQREYMDDARKANPYSYGTGDIGAALVTSAIPGAALGRVAKGVGIASKGGLGAIRALSSAGTGFAQGVGHAGEDDNSLVQGLKGAALGLGAGIIGGKVANAFAPQEAPLVGAALGLGSDEVGARAGSMILNSGSRPILKAATGDLGSAAKKYAREFAVKQASAAKPIIRSEEDLIRAQFKYRNGIADVEDKIQEIIGEEASNLMKVRGDNLQNLFGKAAGRALNFAATPIMGAGKAVGSLFKGTVGQLVSNPSADRVISNAAMSASAGAANEASANLYAPENAQYLESNLPSQPMSP